MGSEPTAPDERSAAELFDELRAVFEARHGDRAGTLKFDGVSTDVSRLRQHCASELDTRQRAALDDAVEQLRTWLIDRDPEASERVRSGGAALAPQDIGTAVRVAHDFGLASMAQGLAAEETAILQDRWRNCRVETIDDRIEAARPKLRLADPGVQLMGLGAVVMLIGLVAAAATGFFPGVLVGMVLVVFGARKWRAGDTHARVGSSGRVNAGGRFGRSPSP